MSALGYHDPVLFVGVDIGISRDTSAVACVYRLDEDYFPIPHFALFDCAIYQPPVVVSQTVVRYLGYLLTHFRVASIAYDPYQFKSEAQRLTLAGFDDKLHEVNQQTEMVAYGNILKAAITNRTFLLYSDPRLYSHFHMAAAEPTERGSRIVKRRQTRPIDAVIAIAMALAMATQSYGGDTGMVFSHDRHRLELEALP